MGGFHCHCVIGWPLRTRLSNRYEGMDVEEGFYREACFAKRGCKWLSGSWWDGEEVGQVLIKYLMKDWAREGSKGMDVVLPWPGAKVPRVVFDAWLDRAGVLK